MHAVLVPCPIAGIGASFCPLSHEGGLCGNGAFIVGLWMSAAPVLSSGFRVLQTGNGRLRANHIVE
ncbi:hypothetical protein [Geobacillus sp. TFV-3]|uniref:hypothetical protein n=1 Tax=Geobacillus sp. TFV-3 TaxID=1897059 RepID=UPI00135AF9DA|nr:hypothetical protein [Geobacillus sp. TFV-3]